MSVLASSWAWSLRGTGPYPKLVLAALADQADDEGYCWPSQSVIAERCEMGERTVRRHIRTLHELGLLTIVPRSSVHGRRSNGYRLHIGARVKESAESRQPVNLAGCGEDADEGPVDNLMSQPVSPEIPATGQIGRLRKRPDWPVAQEATSGRQQQATGGRLHIGGTTNRTTRPDQSSKVTSPAAGDSARVGSGRDDDRPDAAAAVRAGASPSASSPATGGTTDEVKRVIASCLPEHMRAMDAVGARQVAKLLDERLQAGWQPAEIRQVMDQPITEPVRRLSGLVAYRLRCNVDPQLVPGVRRSDDELWAERQRKSEQLATPSRAERDPAWEAAWRQVRSQMPDASRLELAQAAHELVAQRAREAAS
ncbi:helix-turn-helix domain-containing protein [Actinomyces succiniciruminis]|uniref:Helix-turn-helix domain n=1 Tax=Actinomyces succiniciruminis TaxID=1522002 RepID=A0A1L7RI45_9ACTO|nr:Helix-turn-helix domain [Actinomyces succiniciruminis]